MSKRLPLSFLGATLGLTASVLVAQQSDVVVNPLAGNPEAIQAGARTFDQVCSTCHGPAGVGDVRGPALNTGKFDHGGQDADIFRTIRNGVPGTEMDPNPKLPDERVWQLVAYIKSLSAPARPAAAALPAATTGNAQNGETLFFGKADCSTCHEVRGRGGVVGPDLSTIGTTAANLLRDKIVDPNTSAAAGGGGRGGRGGTGGGGRGGRGNAPQWVTVIVKQKDGSEIRGIRRSEDTFSLQMIDATGELHFIDKLKVASLRTDPTSLMPAYGSKLAPGEIEDITAYLASLKPGATSTDANIPGGVPYERLLKASAEPQNWPMFWGNYQGTHYSGLKQITPANAHTLQAQWATAIPGDSILEATPIVVAGIMYVTGSGNPLTVTALDAKTGRQIWRYTREQPVRNPYENNRYNRGVAILGNRLFVGTLDAMLIALDARSGSVLWQTKMADTMEGYELTSPPLVVKDKVIMGISGGEYAIRGFVDAYDATTGKQLWRFYTVPGPGEFGNDTWKGDSWQKGGGAAWLTPTYDPDLNQVYVPVGNPAPQADRMIRGDGLANLFTDSVVALDADTGKRVWHYQFTPNDGHDWDSAEDMILVDRVWHGQMRKLLIHADRNAFLYILDRTNGQFLAATPFVYQNWNKGFDKDGNPITIPGWNSSPEASRLIFPSLGGGTNFQSPSYSAATGYLYLEYAEGGGAFTSGPAEYSKGSQYIGRSQGRGAAPQRAPEDPQQNSAGIKAIDLETGKTVWDFKMYQGSLTNGLLATAGNVVFASMRDGNMVVLDAKTGKVLWHFQTGANMAAAPISYSVDGRQFVVLAAGNFLYGFALPEVGN
jgi:PQQ-dependent dehydrogenase (methanol/ethanol family)